MQTATRRSRWVDPEKAIQFGTADLDICKLLTPGTVARQPWGYTYLPSGYFAGLLRRGHKGIKNRLANLRANPHYVTLADQPSNAHRDLIYRIGRGGVARLEDEGVVAKARSKALPHELLACVIAASFEIASARLQRPIQAVLRRELAVQPDWPPFRFFGRTIFIEADMGTETNRPTRGPDATRSNIANKFTRYLSLAVGCEIENPFFAFLTCKPGRIEGWVETLMRVIDTNGYDQDHAECFGFMAVEYDRFLNTIPMLSAWAATDPFVRPGFEPFRFNEQP
jgi:hypothetical protein